MDGDKEDRELLEALGHVGWKAASGSAQADGDLDPEKNLATKLSRVQTKISLLKESAQEVEEPKASSSVKASKETQKPKGTHEVLKRTKAIAVTNPSCETDLDKENINKLKDVQTAYKPQKLILTPPQDNFQKSLEAALSKNITRKESVKMAESNFSSTREKTKPILKQDNNPKKDVFINMAPIKQSLLGNNDTSTSNIKHVTIEKRMKEDLLTPSLVSPSKMNLKTFKEGYKLKSVVTASPKVAETSSTMIEIKCPKCPQKFSGLQTKVTGLLRAHIGNIHFHNHLTEEIKKIFVHKKCNLCKEDINGGVSGRKKHLLFSHSLFVDEIQALMNTTFQGTLAFDNTLIATSREVAPTLKTHMLPDTVIEPTLEDGKLSQKQPKYATKEHPKNEGKHTGKVYSCNICTKTWRQHKNITKYLSDHVQTHIHDKFKTEIQKSFIGNKCDKCGEHVVHDCKKRSHLYTKHGSHRSEIQETIKAILAAGKEEESKKEKEIFHEIDQNLTEQPVLKSLEKDEEKALLEASLMMEQDVSDSDDEEILK